MTRPTAYLARLFPIQIRHYLEDSTSLRRGQPPVLVNLLVPRLRPRPGHIPRSQAPACPPSDPCRAFLFFPAFSFRRPRDSPPLDANSFNFLFFSFLFVFCELAAEFDLLRTLVRLRRPSIALERASWPSLLAESYIFFLSFLPAPNSTSFEILRGKKNPKPSHQGI